MRCTAGSSLLNSQSTCLFPGHFCCTSGIEVLQTGSLAAQSPRREAGFSGPAVRFLPGSGAQECCSLMEV